MSDLLRLLFPMFNACHLCGRALAVDHANGLCNACTKALQAQSLIPHDMRSMHDPLIDCLAAYRYKGAARDMVRVLKFAGDPAAAIAPAEGMTHALAVSERLCAIDAVVPVPLSPMRLRERGYNQAELLSREVCAHTGLLLLPHALTRTAELRTQLSRTRAERLNALRGIFHADAFAVYGRTLLLIDDVLTTGATAVSCAETLLAAGAKGVLLLTACRA